MGTHYWARFVRFCAQFTAGGSWTDLLQPLTRQNLRWFWFDGLFASASDAAIFTYQTLYLLALGASDTQIGILSSISSLSGVFILLPGAFLAERTGKRKEVALISGGIVGRLTLLAMILVPIMFHGQTAVFVAITLTVLRDALNSMGLPAWISLTADLVPLSWRGRYFGSRNFIMGVAAMGATLLFGEIITRADQLRGYQAAYAIALVFGAVSTFSFSRISEPVQKPQSSPKTVPINPNYSLKGTLLGVRTHPAFLAYCLTSAIWNFSLNISGPFFAPFQVKTLGASATMVGILAIASQVSSILTQQPFGRMADRWGARRLVVLTGFLIPILPVTWIFIQEAWQGVPLNVLGGALWAGYSLASFNFLLSITPENQRTRFSAIYQIVVGLSLAAGAAVGSMVVSRYGYYAVFTASGVGRFLAAVLFAWFVRPVEVESITHEHAEEP